MVYTGKSSRIDSIDGPFTDRVYTISILRAMASVAGWYILENPIYKWI
jgi:hypothetical protein